MPRRRKDWDPRVPVKTLRTAAQEKADEMRKMDAPLVGNYGRGDRVKVDRAWLRHWTFKDALKPTRSLWRKLVEEGGGVVEKTDPHGNVWVLDRFGQFHGGSFPVPARFIYHRGESAEMGAAGAYRVEVIADDSGQWVGNQLTFATREEAEQYAKDLAGRWTAVRDWRVVGGSPEMGIAYPEAPRSTRARGPGYDLDLPSMPPFMYVEEHKKLGDLGVLAYGAYNAMGLIGPEKGGVAVVFEHPEKAVLAAKDFPYDPQARDREIKRIIRIIKGLGPLSPVPREALEGLVRELESSGYEIRR